MNMNAASYKYYYRSRARARAQDVSFSTSHRKFWVLSTEYRVLSVSGTV